MYDTAQYASSRLESTWVRGDRGLFKVRQCFMDNGKICVAGSFLSDLVKREGTLPEPGAAPDDGDPVRVIARRRDAEEREREEGRGIRKSDSIVKLSDLDISPLNLGNINFLCEAPYVQRIPLRNDWRQGTRIRSIKVWTKNKEVTFALQSESLSFWKAVEDSSIKGEYPPLYEAMERVEDLFYTSAFSPRFKVDRRGRLVYKNDKVVGECEVEPRLDNKHVWLAEALEEDMRNVVL